LLEYFNHLLEKLVKLVLEVIIITRENEEGNSLHSIALGNIDQSWIGEDTTLHIPKLHLFLQDFFWLSINAELDDFLPLL